MGVVDIAYGWTGRSSSQTSPDGKSFSESRTLPVSIQTTGPDVDEATVLASLPSLKAQLPGLPWFRLTDRKVMQAGPVYWKGALEYSSSIEPDNNPVDMVPRFRWSTIRTEEPIDRDFDGKPIVTANGEPIEGVKGKFRIFVLEITRNLPSFNPLAIINYIDTTNSDTYLGCAPGQLYMDDLSADEVVTEDYVYFAARAVIHLRRPPFGATNAQTWYTRILHAGYIEKLPSLAGGSFQLNVVDEAGAALTKPIRLKEDGTRETDPTKAHWLYKKVAGTSNFASLGMT